MSRKDTIIFAVIINVGLLIFLFSTAMRTESTAESVIATKESEEMEVSAKPQLIADASAEPSSPKSDVDFLLSQLPQTSAPVQTPAAMVTDASLLPTSSMPNSVATTQVPLSTPEISLTVAPAMPSAQALPKPSAAASSASYVEVTVKRGDVLERIARANGASVEEIMEVNNLLDTKLRIGQVLKIPMKATVNKEEAPAKNNEMPPAPKDKDADDSKFYVVRSGDNPWSIAMRHRMSLDELLKINNLNEDKARRLKPGDRLRVR